MTDSLKTVWRSVRSAIVVLAITFLIWVAADQNVLETTTFPITVRLASENRDTYIGFAEPPYERMLTVTVSGRRRRLGEFVERLKATAVYEVRLDGSQRVAIAPQSLSASDDVLSKIRDVRESRLNIRNVEPRDLLVRIDSYETLPDVRVEPDYGDLQVQAEIVQKTVAVRLPRFVCRDASLAGQPSVVAAAQQRIREAAQPDGRFEIKAPLRMDLIEHLDPGIRVQFLPSAEVSIRGSIRAMTESRTIGPIQIKWYTPDEIQKDYVIVKDDADLRVHIDVTGPKGRVEQLDPADILGMIEVRAGDLNDPGPGVEIPRQVRFILPKEFPDCELSPAAQTYEIRFKLMPRRGNGTETPSS